MKTLVTLPLLLISSILFSQVIVGDEIGTSPNKSSVLLEFAANQNKGIILPYIKTIPSGSSLAEGTILLDATDSTKAKVIYYNGSWKDLSSGNEADITSAMAYQHTTTVEDTTKGVIIGSETSSADGVLILESSNKALVLPQVNSTDDIINPAPGMMVYINLTNAKRLAVFNGSRWTFWKP